MAKEIWGIEQNDNFCHVQDQKVKKVRSFENNENYEINFKPFVYVLILVMNVCKYRYMVYLTYTKILYILSMLSRYVFRYNILHITNMILSEI